MSNNMTYISLIFKDFHTVELKKTVKSRSNLELIFVEKLLYFIKKENLTCTDKMSL